MQQFTVPKFIDQEDKIIAFITVRQFLIMIVAGILIAICYAILAFWYFVAAAVVIALSFGVLAFLPVNGRPFHYFLISTIERIKKPRVRVWNKELNDAELRHYIKQKNEEQPKKQPLRPRFTSSQLSQLSLVVDTGGSYGGEDVFESITPLPIDLKNKAAKKA